MSKNKGFTIVELLIVIIVIAIIAAIAIVAYGSIRTRAAEAVLIDSASTVARSLEADRAERGEYAPSLDAISFGGGADQAVGQGVSYQYSIEGTGAEMTYCLTASTASMSFYVSSTNRQPKSGACPGHTSAQANPVQIISKTASFISENGIPGGNKISIPIGVDLQPNDMVFVLLNADHSLEINRFSINGTEMNRAYYRSMGPDGYQKIIAYTATGLSGSQTIETTMCGISAYFCGSSHLHISTDYIIYVIRGLQQKRINFTDTTTFGRQTVGEQIGPAAQSVRKGQLAIFSYVLYGNGMPDVKDLSEPARSWLVDGDRTSSYDLPGSGKALASYSVVVQSNGLLRQGFTTKGSLAYAGAVTFVFD